MVNGLEVTGKKTGSSISTKMPNSKYDREY